MMPVLTLVRITTCLAFLILTSASAHCEKSRSKQKPSRPATAQRVEQKTKLLWPKSRYRGWDYLVARLRDNGVSEQDLASIYSDPRMPERTFVGFSVKPKEPAAIYEGFKQPRHRELGRQFVNHHSGEFDRIEKTLLVPREVVAAIIVIESGVGKNTGSHLLVYRLSRLATTNAPDNLRENYVLQKKKDHHLVFEDVRRRGRYLENTFLHEIPALITIAKRNKIDVFSMKGSSAGAFGLPQFLPSAFLRFGLDGNNDGIVSLHNEQDAIWSAANYLASFGFRRDIPYQEKRSIIWRYNKSSSYIDAVLALSEQIRGER